MQPTMNRPITCTPPKGCRGARRLPGFSGLQAHPHPALEAPQDRRDAPQPQRRDHLVQPHLRVEVVRYRQDLIGRQPVEPLVKYAREAARRGRLLRRVEEHVDPALVVDILGEEERRLALVHLLHLVPMLFQIRRQRRHLFRVLEQHRQPERRRRLLELGGYLLQLLWHAHNTPIIPDTPPASTRRVTPVIAAHREPRAPPFGCPYPPLPKPRDRRPSSRPTTFFLIIEYHFMPPGWNGPPSVGRRPRRPGRCREGARRGGVRDDSGSGWAHKIREGEEY